MRFGILGPLEVVDDEGRQLDVGARRLAEVLAIMLVYRDGALPAERLAAELWGQDAPANAPKAIQVYVSRLRQRLPAAVLETRAAGYRLALDDGAVDVEVFERLAREGRARLAAGDPRGARERMRAALALWRGDPLSDFSYEPFAQTEIARLEEARLEALEGRIDAELALGAHHELVAELTALVREHPRRERLQAQLILALYRCGRHADALDRYQAARRQLVDELGIEPGQALRELHQAVLEQDPRLILAVPAQATVAPTNLPARPRTIVGRDAEQAEICANLRAGAGAPVSITGMGGSGKTVLALAVGAALLDWAVGGVYVVRLAGTRDPRAVLPMIAEAVGVIGDGDRSLGHALAQRLGREPTVLILDNFEQLVEAAPLVVELLDDAPELRVLVTSQVALRVAREYVFALGPLARADAAALFLDRARARDRSFQPTDGDQVIAEQICALLDDVPLAIELAAARVTSLGVAELLPRLERPLTLLTRGARDAPARQRSLRAAIDWTYALLEPGHRDLLARCGVCAGAVPLTLLEALAADAIGEPEFLDGVDVLVDYSFARRRRDPAMGDLLLVPQALRDYALEVLTEAGLEPAMRQRHAEHVLGVAHAARLGKWGASDEERARLQAISGEIRPAVAWARSHDPLLHVRLCAALAGFWLYSGVLGEVVEEFGWARASGAGDVAERAWILTALAKCVQLGAPAGDAGTLTDEALEEWRAVDDEVEQALGLQHLSWVIRWEARYDEAIAIAQRALAVLRATHDRRLILRGLVFLAHTYADAQDVAATEAVLDEAEALAGGEPVWELSAIRGDCATTRGDDRAALACYLESLAWTRTTGESHQLQMDLSCLVLPLARLGCAQAALEVFELVRLERERTGRPGDLPTGLAWLQEAVGLAREQLSSRAAEEPVARARQVAVTERAARAVEVAGEALAVTAPRGA